MRIKIRLIDANHCPGSALIYLDGPLGSVLHTGDFRSGGFKMIKEIGVKKLDYLYLDNTFIDPDEDFPTQA